MKEGDNQRDRESLSLAYARLVHRHRGILSITYGLSLAYARLVHSAKAPLDCRSEAKRND